MDCATVPDIHDRQTVHATIRYLSIGAYEDDITVLLKIELRIVKAMT